MAINNTHVDAIIAIIEVNENLVKYDYKGQEDLISITSELKSKIATFTDSIADENLDKKELIKHAIRVAFELEESDIVIMRSDQIFIKLLDDLVVHKVAEDEKNTIANRYNGIEESALESFQTEIFEKHTENEDFFFYIAEQFVNKYFLIKNIDNLTYENSAFPIIQSLITDRLMSLFDNNEEFFKGFAGYIFRIHFKEVFELISEMVLAEICSSNQYMINFLKYYSQDIILVNGKKYKVPAIEAENGLKWNVASMMSIVRIYIKAQYAIETNDIKSQKLEDEIKSSYINDISPIEYNQQVKKELDTVAQEKSYMEKKLLLYVDTFDNSNDQLEKQNLKSDIAKIKINLLELKESKEELLSLQLDNTIITHYVDIKRELDYLKRQTEREKKIVKQNGVSYMSIKHALVKALTSKKVLIGNA